ncbi:MAG TPA: RIO1 family regulatory kinase/ATPase [Thermoplasmata archaeon]|nr:RIO1 family regulatory kinase/ATPase [Thermoplasmata archaeon]
MPNQPYLDASVQWRIKAGTLDLHEPGYRSTAEAILSSGLATEVVGLISAGKEADVYLGRYHGASLAIKVYRLYRTSHRGGGPIKADSMGWRAAHEFEITRQAWKGGARVPAPARRVENMFSMRYLGDDDGPAPRLHDIRLDDPESFLAAVLGGVEALARAGVVHGDLSAFNVLVHDRVPWFIDFSEAFRIDRTGTSSWMRLTEATEALRRGVNALAGYFRKYGIGVDPEPLIARAVTAHDRFGVLK